jgi:Fic family protein
MVQFIGVWCCAEAIVAKLRETMEEAAPFRVKDIEGTHFCMDATVEKPLSQLSARVWNLRSGGKLTSDVLRQIRRFFRIKHIYHSNAIEGNMLEIGETREVVEHGLTLTGKPLKDQAEAKNLSHAIDFLEEIAQDTDRKITEKDVRQLHYLVLKNIDDENAGKYRTTPVSISGSDYKPTEPASIPAEMEQFGDWLQSVTEGTREYGSTNALLDAAVAHTWFVQIHPFVDGNGRVARLLMNLMLMRNGYPIAVITSEDRHRYYDALEVSQGADLTPLLSLVAECIDESLEEYEAAVQRKQEESEWAEALAAQFEQPERVRISNQYEVWKSAMELVRARFRQTCHLLEDSFKFGKVFFNDFGHLPYEKYIVLRSGESAKRTWFFRVDLVRSNKSARYLFFFRQQSVVMRNNGCRVTLFIAKENPPGSFNYDRLEHIVPAPIPNMIELGYNLDGETFMYREKDDSIQVATIDNISQHFFDEVVSLDFANKS